MRWLGVYNNYGGHGFRKQNQNCGFLWNQAKPWELWWHCWSLSGSEELWPKTGVRKVTWNETKATSFLRKPNRTGYGNSGTVTSWDLHTASRVLKTDRFLCTSCPWQLWSKLINKHQLTYLCNKWVSCYGADITRDFHVSLAKLRFKAFSLMTSAIMLWC